MKVFSRMTGIVAIAMLVFGMAGVTTAQADDFSAQDSDGGPAFDCGVGFVIIKTRTKGQTDVWLNTTHNGWWMKARYKNTGDWQSKTTFTNLHRVLGWKVNAFFVDSQNTFVTCGFD